MRKNGIKYRITLKGSNIVIIDDLMCLKSAGTQAEYYRFTENLSHIWPSTIPVDTKRSQVDLTNFMNKKMVADQ
jgi:hypothetical protein